MKRVMMAVLAVAMLVPSIAAAQAQFNGTLGFAPLGGGVIIGSSNLGTATGFSFIGTGSAFVNTVPATFQGLPNDFATNGVTISLNSVQGVLNLPTFAGISAGSPINDLFGFANNRFQFNLTSLTPLSNVGSNGGLNGSGILVDTSGIYAPTNAAFSLSTSSATNYAVSFATLPVPEPSTYALMVAGLGLVAFAARRRLAS